MSGIILDTNVVSEPKRPAPDSKVRSWFAAQDVDRLYLTTTVIGELAVGTSACPPAEGAPISGAGSKLWCKRISPAAS